MRTYPKTFGLLTCLIMASGWTACGGSTEKNTDEDPNSSASELMRRAQSCADLEDALKQEARARLVQMMREQPSHDDEWGSGGSGGAMSVDAGAGVGGSGGFSGTGGTAGSGGSTSGAGGLAGSGSTPPDEFTGTNTQVANVDEADFVKTDGTRIYQLRANMLHVAKAWPAPELALQSSVQIEGQPIDMFLVGDAGSPDQRLVIYSRVDGTPIYAQAGLEPPNPGVTSPEDPWGAGGSGGSGWDEPAPAVYLTKITVVSVAGLSPAVAHEVYFDGDYLSSRRTDLHVRTVLSVAGRLPELTTTLTEADLQKAQLVVLAKLLSEGRDVAEVPSEELQAMVNEALGDMLVKENEEAFASISYTDWLPHVFTKTGGQLVVSAVACEDFYIPKAGTSQFGITHVAPLDLSNLASPSTGTAFVGVADTMYQNASAMVLASAAYEATKTQVGWSTYVHAFDLDGQPMPAYKGSGVVQGRIYGQFALDEKDGFVRVVTTSGERWSSEGTTNHLFLLETVDGKLEVAGDVGAFGHDEEVYAVRFVGDTAYVVTFRETDPLFAIDLSNPRAPQILGELHIPGFSEYMHPLGTTHLLTVGRDADPDTGWSRNLALQIFDVTDRTQPQLAHKLIFDGYGVSAAEYDHKAFTFFDDRSLLAIPYVAESYEEGTWYYRMESSMQLFRVTVQEGIVSIGAMSGNPLLSDAERDPANYTCYPGYSYGSESGSSFQRGIFMDDVIYGIARDGVVAAKVNQPSQPLGVLNLADPSVVPDNCYPNGGYGGSGGGGVGGSGGSEWDGGVAGAGGGEWDGGAAGFGGDDWDGGAAAAGGSGGMDWDAGAAGGGD